MEGEEAQNTTPDAGSGEVGPARPEPSEVDSGTPLFQGSYDALPADPPPLAYVTESMAETTRKSGLAWSAGIVLFASIAFTLVLGWFADLILGTSPWGIVGGIVLGSIIGFVQFFRITSRIFGKTDVRQTPPRTLISDDSDEK